MEMIGILPRYNTMKGHVSGTLLGTHCKMSATVQNDFRYLTPRSQATPRQQCNLLSLSLMVTLAVCDRSETAVSKVVRVTRKDLTVLQ